MGGFFMAEFTPITSQEQFDSMVKERLARNDEKWAKKYEGYISPEDVKSKYDKQIADLTTSLDAAAKKQAAHDKELADRDAQIKTYETRANRARIAHEEGLSYDAIDFLKGDTEAEIKASASALKNLMGSRKPNPDFTPDEKVATGGDTRAAMRKLAQSLGSK
jgi:hypothetical protein